MTEPNIFQTVMYFIALVSVIGFIIWLGWRRGHQNALNAKEYDRRYILIDVSIDKYPVNNYNREWLLKMLEDFRELKYKDTARTVKLINKFNDKFEAEESRIMKEFENNK